MPGDQFEWMWSGGGEQLPVPTKISEHLKKHHHQWPGKVQKRMQEAKKEKLSFRGICRVILTDDFRDSKEKNLAGYATTNELCRSHPLLHWWDQEEVLWPQFANKRKCDNMNIRILPSRKWHPNHSPNHCTGDHVCDHPGAWGCSGNQEHWHLSTWNLTKSVWIIYYCYFSELKSISKSP